MSESPTDPGPLLPGEPGSGRSNSDKDDTRPQRPQAPPPYWRSDAPTQSGGQRQPAAPPPDSAGQTRRSASPLPGPAASATPPPPGNYPGVTPGQSTRRSSSAPRRPHQPVSLGQWLLRGFIVAAMAIVALSLLIIAAGVAGYFYIAAELPSPEELQNRTFTFASSQIYDRNGNLLWELMDPSAGRRTWVPLSRVSPYLQQATIATEDRFFYQNVGVDPIAVVRPLLQPQRG
jgi:hypothetical protein